MFLIKIAQKKGYKKKLKTKNKRKSEKSEKEKNEAKWKQSKKCIKEICQGNYEKKSLYNFSNLQREEILKLKIKIKNLQ